MPRQSGSLFFASVSLPRLNVCTALMESAAANGSPVGFFSKCCTYAEGNLVVFYGALSVTRSI